jgi:hydrogenase expression/formation protein HypC
VPDAKAGDYVVVHVGFAISKLDEEEAGRTYRLLEEIGQLIDLETAAVDDKPDQGDP